MFVARRCLFWINERTLYWTAVQNGDSPPGLLTDALIGKRPSRSRDRQNLWRPGVVVEIYASAFFTRSSVNGAWRNRTPVIAITALETAGVIAGVAI